MSKWAIILVAFHLVWSAYGKNEKKQYCDIPGYYWRDYSPEDALPCGVDDIGEPMFVGQTLYGGYLIPGKIYVDYPALYIEAAGKEFEYKRKFKILCAAEKEFFEWIQTNGSTLLHIKDRHLVVGGYDPNGHTFIGRKKIGKELLVAKILAYNNNPLIACSNGKCKTYESYEVLAYHPVIRS